MEELPENLPSIRNLKSRFETSAGGGGAPEPRAPAPVHRAPAAVHRAPAAVHSAPAASTAAAVNGYSDDASDDDVTPQRDDSVLRETHEKEEVRNALGWPPSWTPNKSLNLVKNIVQC